MGTSRTTHDRVRAVKKVVKDSGEGEGEQYAAAFARVRLVRAWIAVVAALVTMLSGYVALLERLLTWWSRSHGWHWRDATGIFIQAVQHAAWF